MTGLKLKAFLGATSLALAGCAVDLEPLTPAEISEVAADREARLLASDQEALTGALGLHEAMARALKYNLDHQIETRNILLARSSKDLSEMDLLPDLVADAEFSRRNNEPGGRSVNLETGVTSATPSRSDERTNSDANLTLSWDVLDYGLSYYRAQQSANDVLIAQEQRRAVVNRLMESTRTAYWRAVSDERLSGRISRVLRKADRALAQSRSLSNGGFSDRTEGLIYQRDLLRVIGEMQALKRDLSTAKPQLAALTNLRPGAKFNVRVPSRKTLPNIHQSAGQLVQMAYQNRPELREITYEQRNLELDEKAVALELLPSIRPFLTASIDNNDLLEEGQFLSAGTRVSWDLISLFNNKRRKQVFGANKALLDARALALTHAVATQVHISKARYDLLRKETRTTAQFAAVSAQISRAIQAESASGLTGLQEEVFEEVGAILAELRFDARYAELQSSYASVFQAVGLNNYPGELTGTESLDTLETAIHDMWRQRGEGLH